MSNEKCGIYQIVCGPTGKRYIGSSVTIYRRWYQHRNRLRRNKHTSPHLQHAWNKHGEDTFYFSILEECEKAVLTSREQSFIDELQPEFNSMTDVQRHQGPEVLAKRAAALRARAARITHCPHGHPYDEKNTYRNKKNKRICLACHVIRNREKYHSMTVEQQEIRRQKEKERYEKNREARLAKARDYAVAHKAEKHEYDKARWARQKAAR